MSPDGDDPRISAIEVPALRRMKLDQGLGGRRGCNRDPSIRDALLFLRHPAVPLVALQSRPSKPGPGSAAALPKSLIAPQSERRQGGEPAHGLRSDCGAISDFGAYFRAPARWNGSMSHQSGVGSLLSRRDFRESPVVSGATPPDNGSLGSTPPQGLQPFGNSQRLESPLDTREIASPSPGGFRCDQPAIG